jgi:hypothetical protein
MMPVMFGLGLVWGKLRDTTKCDHAPLPQSRTDVETVWGLGLNPYARGATRPLRRGRRFRGRVGSKASCSSV